MTPVFRAASNHKYDTADYTASTRASAATPTSAASPGSRQARHARGPDTSLNHTGSDSRYFDRFGNFAGPDGQSIGAFANGRPNPSSAPGQLVPVRPTKKDPSEQYQGWVGVKDLPELNKDSPAWRDFAYRAPDSVTRHWLRAGASGWRMDVAPWVNDDFWREWSAR
jgi:cyclomaltodextrinase